MTGPAPSANADNLVVIGGTTAGGKSTLALRLADATGGCIINADSVQQFKDLPILTARPTASDERRVPHKLYGFLDAQSEPSVIDWLARAEKEIEACRRAGQLPIVTGGTGFYILALLQGIAAIPDTEPAIREEVRALDTEAAYTALAAEDPLCAERLKPQDRQRILRALEVIRSSGKSLQHWQAQPRRKPDLPAHIISLALLPERKLVWRRVEQRHEAMIQAGLIEEIEAFIKEQQSQPSRLLGADGVREFEAFLEGRISREEASQLTVFKGRRYAKRQRTFFKTQLPELAPIEATGEDEALLKMLQSRL